MENTSFLRYSCYDANIGDRLIAVQITVIMTCRHAREDENRSVSERIKESRHYIKSLKLMGSKSHDLGTDLGMHSLQRIATVFKMRRKSP